MPLPSGSKIGPYDVLGPLGAGGMGEVFRARDSRLGRDVAVKALPQAFAADPERLARFEREARLLASLSHPNIAGIHGLEEKDGQRFLILEFVDGETLAERLKRGPLPIDDALEVAGQVAAALEAAHDAGIVHRDLKPGNIMVTPNGAVRVLDFGLAKAGGGTSSSSDQHLSASPTMTYAATAAGVILGTAAYMSPEQARGKAVDRRTDIWSLGCVLFECLAGRMSFGGETISDTIAQILAVEPDWSALPAATPPSIRALLKRCLEKDPKKRLRDAGDVRLFIEEALAGNTSGLATAAAGAAGGPVSGTPATAVRSRAAFLPWGIAAVALLAAVAGWLWPRGVGPTAPKPPVRAHVLAPTNLLFTDQPADQALSPDGRLLAFVAVDSVGTGSIWIRPIASLDARRIPMPLTSQIGMVFWSPDSRHIGYMSDGKLRRIGIDGESALTLADAPEPRGACWGTNGDILFVPMSGGPIYRVPATGGVATVATTLDTASGETAHRFPQFLPDGRRFTYVSVPRRGNDLVTWITDVDGAPARELAAATSGVIIADERTFLFTRGSALMAQRVDPKSLAPAGSPIRIGDSPTNLGTLGTPPVSVSSTGDLVFQERFQDILYVDRYEIGGRRLGRFPLPEALWYAIDISPDGRTVALLRSEDLEYGDIWMADPERGQPTPLTKGERVGSTVVWSPDSREVAYMNYDADGQKMVTRSVYGGSEARVVFRSASTFKDITDWSPDGRFLIFMDLEPKTRRDLWMVPVSGGEPVPIARGPASETNGRVSGDGRWLAFISDETGRAEAYVQAFPTGGPRVRVTEDGGAIIIWQGSTLYYSDGNATREVSVTGEGDRPEFVSRRNIGSRVPGSFGGDIFPGSREGLVIVTPERSEVRLVVLRDWESLLNAPAN